MPRLYDLCRERGCKTVTIAGLAKNTGKTVTFNRVVEEAAADDQDLLLASLGHDGEPRDALFQHRKPRIKAPAGSYYATVEDFAGDSAQRELIGALGIQTALGEVGLYRAGKDGVSIELCGLNHNSHLEALGQDPRSPHDLYLIDGAIDRRSAAVPGIADGVIVATGAALGGSPAQIAARTHDAVERLCLPAWTADAPPSRSERATLRRDGELRDLDASTWLAGDIPDQLAELRDGDAVFFPGALSDPLATSLLRLPKEARFDLIVQDGTKVFASSADLSRLAARGIPTLVRRRIDLLAVTVNPFNPRGPDLDRRDLEDRLRQALPDTPVLNVLFPTH